MQMSTNVRYIVNSTSDLTVYELLGFRVVMQEIIFYYPALTIMKPPYSPAVLGISDGQPM